jgi:ParB-like chromosome segregation protein Spo0J
VLRDVGELIGYARNARTHSDAQVAQIAASIVEFGWTNPVLADDVGIVAGHGRVMAARLMYGQGRTIKLPNGTPIPSGTVPVLDCTGWSAAQRKAYILADNALALQAGWDMELLAVEIGELQAEGFDLSLVGFSDDELKRITFDGNFEPGGEDEQSRIDKISPLMVVCPHCGGTFDAKAGDE